MRTINKIIITVLLLTNTTNSHAFLFFGGPILDPLKSALIATKGALESVEGAAKRVSKETKTLVKAVQTKQQLEAEKKLEESNTPDTSFVPVIQQTGEERYQALGVQLDAISQCYPDSPNHVEDNIAPLIATKEALTLSQTATKQLRELNEMQSTESPLNQAKVTTLQKVGSDTEQLFSVKVQRSAAESVRRLEDINEDGKATRDAVGRGQFSSE